VHALALVQAARVVVGDHPLDRGGELDPPLLDEVVDQLDPEDDLELVVVAVVLGVVLGEGDVVVRVGTMIRLAPTARQSATLWSAWRRASST
jgi:hypothetical protein